MTIHEPMTLVTDYVLGGVTAWLAWRLWQDSQRQRARRFWAEAFALLAIGAFLGGTWHGFLQSDLLWKATLLSVAAASFTMVVGSLYSSFSGTPRAVLVWIAALKLIVTGQWMLRHDDFLIVIIDTGIAFAMVAALHVWKWNGLLLGGVALSVAAALAQASGFRLHQHFNHNDLYHVIQIAAMALLYRGARRLSDATTPTPAPPAAGQQP